MTKKQQQRDQAIIRRKKVADIMVEQSATATRRTKIETLVLSGATQRSMARTLGVSPSTINHDLKVLRKEWRTQALHALEVAIMNDVQRVDRLIFAIWAEAITGKDLAKIEMVRRLIETRAKLLDYDKIDLQRVAEEAERDGKSVAARITMIEVVKSYSDDSDDGDDL